MQHHNDSVTTCSAYALLEALSDQMGEPQRPVAGDEPPPAREEDRHR